MINPGNPTGSILSEETIRKIIEFSVKNKIVLIADEVIRILLRFIERISTKIMQISYHSEKFWKPCSLKLETNASWLLCILFLRDFLENVV